MASRTDPEGWVDAYGDGLYRYALAQLGDRHLAEEVVQETFRAALQARDRFKGQASERTWLHSILKRKIIDCIRRQVRERKTETLDGTDPAESDRFNARGHWSVPPKRWRDDPEQLLERREFREVLTECIGNLSEAMGRAFTLREMMGLSTEEICKVLGVTRTNLWVMLHRARRQLRDCLERGWFGEAKDRSRR